MPRRACRPGSIRCPRAGGVGIGPRQTDAPSGPPGLSTSNLLAGSRTPFHHLTRACERAPARSLPAPGSLNSWHHRILASQGGPHEPLALLVGAVPEDRRRSPATDAEVGPRDAGSGQLLVDDQLVHRVGTQPVGRGPVRCQVAALGELGPLLVSGQAAMRRARARTSSR